ncbi:hypothetical protein D3C78_1667720 [compost metagenome]
MQLLQVVVFDGCIPALEKADAIEQVFGRILPKLGALRVVPGIHQHVVAPFAQTQQRPGPRHLLEITGITGPRQRGADDIGGQSAIDQRSVSEGRPGIGN